MTAQQHLGLARLECNSAHSRCEQRWLAARGGAPTLSSSALDPPLCPPPRRGRARALLDAAPADEGTRERARAMQRREAVRQRARKGGEGERVGPTTTRWARELCRRADGAAVRRRRRRCCCRSRRGSGGEGGRRRRGGRGGCRCRRGSSSRRRCSVRLLGRRVRLLGRRVRLDLGADLAPALLALVQLGEALLLLGGHDRPVLVVLGEGPRQLALDRLEADPTGSVEGVARHLLGRERGESVSEPSWARRERARRRRTQV